MVATPSDQSRQEQHIRMPQSGTGRRLYSVDSNRRLEPRSTAETASGRHQAACEAGAQASTRPRSSPWVKRRVRSAIVTWT